MRLRTGIYITCLTLLLAVPCATAQTTQPAPELWGQTMQALGAALVSEDPSSVLNGIITDDVPLREFGASRIETRQRLVLRAEGMQVISIRTYVWPATTIASDLAADIKACETIPPSLKNSFIPRDENDARKANATAQQWVMSVIEPATKDLFAVVMLWEPPASATSILLATNPPPEPKQPLFLFIKGKQKHDGEVQITSISFGDAKQALK